MNNLNIYIWGDNSPGIYPVLDHVKNSSENDFSLFFMKVKYQNLPVNNRVMVLDLPDIISAEWIVAICNFAKKINAGSVKIHSAISYVEGIIFHLIKAFQSQVTEGLALSLFLYETRLSDVVCRKTFSGELNKKNKLDRYSKEFQRKFLTDNLEWDSVYNYLFNNIVNTKYFLSDSLKEKMSSFFSTPCFCYLSDVRDENKTEAVESTLTILGVDINVINTINDVCNNHKTVFVVDDGIEHPLGNKAKDTILLHEFENQGFEFVFLINYKGMIQQVNQSTINIISLPDYISLDLLLFADVMVECVYGFCSVELLSSKKEIIKRILFHEDSEFGENIHVKNYLDSSSHSDAPRLYIDETNAKLAGSYTPKHIFLMAESMGDVLFAVGGLNALRERLNGPFICITPKVYHSLLSLCPWVDEQWEWDKLSKEQAEDVYISRFLGNIYLPSKGEHIFDKKHQIDSFLVSLGYKNINNHCKEIVLSLDEVDKTKVDDFLLKNGLKSKIVLIHPNVGVPNRTWPQQSWAEIIDKFIKDGWSVILIGSNNNFYSHKKAVDIENNRIFNAIDKFTMGETVYLMTQSSLLVACDSGPVALAGATDIAICALYSVVPGKYRLPYRHGVQGWNALAINRTCKYVHCASTYTHLSGDTFDAWCPNNKQYSCMNGYTSDEFYREVTQFLASKNYIDCSCPT